MGEAEQARGPARATDAAPPQGDIATIQVLRGLASLSVVWFHIAVHPDIHWAPLKASGAYAWLGVDVFFVISGFVIPYALDRQAYRVSEFPRFMLRRIVRLEPPYIASLVVIILLGLASAMAPGFRGELIDLTPLRILAHFFYLIPVTSYGWYNPVYWTLAYEFVFYLSLGLLWPVLGRRNILWIVAAFGAVAAAFQLAAGEVPDRMFLFLAGIAAARFYMKTLSAPWFGAALAAATGLTFLVAGPASAAAALLAPLVLVFVKLPRYPILMGLGTISYSLYLLHVPFAQRVMNLLLRQGHSPVYETAVAISALAVALGVSVVFWKLIEQPCHQLSRRLFRSQR